MGSSHKTSMRSLEMLTKLLIYMLQKKKKIVGIFSVSEWGLIS